MQPYISLLPMSKNSSYYKDREENKNNILLWLKMGFLSGSAGKESTGNAGDSGDTGSIPGLGRSPGGGNGNPLQYSCLENSMDRGDWWVTVHGVTKSQIRLSTWPMIKTRKHIHSFEGNHGFCQVWRTLSRRDFSKGYGKTYTKTQMQAIARWTQRLLVKSC